jgi:hypothetical protein
MNRNTVLLLLNLFVFALTLSAVMLHHKRKKEEPLQRPQVQIPVKPEPQPQPEPKPEPEPEKPKEPGFKNYPAIRQVGNLGVVLSDIESHMPAGHIYRDNDKITWAHETSHGLASNIRQKFSRGGYCAMIDGAEVFLSADRINGFYVLKDRAIVLHEPNGKLSQVSQAVPSSLKGDVYGLYLQRQAASWNDYPLYVLDEWIAYSNGSATRADLKITGRAESVQYMMEFCAYAIVMVKTLSPDQDVKDFVKWHLERCMGILKDNPDASGAVSYWNKVKASELKGFCFSCFGQDWCQRVLGF